MTKVQDKQNAVRILDYWFTMEFLNQQSLREFKKIERDAQKYKKAIESGSAKFHRKSVSDFVTIKAGDSLKSVFETESKALCLYTRNTFTVFFGRMKKETCIKKIAANVAWNGESPEANLDEIALAALQFSKDGNYISGSLSVSPLAWAAMKLSDGTADASAKLSPSEYEAEVKNIEKQVSDLFASELEPEADPLHQANTIPFSYVATYDLLRNVEAMVCQELRINPSDADHSYAAVYFKLYKSEKDVEEQDEQNSLLHMDFFSTDLKMAADGLRHNRFTQKKESLLLDYILGIYRDEDRRNRTEDADRLDIINPASENELYGFMKDTLAALKAPLGKWPSRFMPALMQQIAINLAIDEGNELSIFSVNGPPGTGKTTLLKEIIVNNVVNKAKILTDYEDPDQAFDDYAFKYGKGPGQSYSQYVRKYHKLRNGKINQYSVLVASSNNTAVENITKELPVEQKILDDIAPMNNGDEPNNRALAELVDLFTVSKSSDSILIKTRAWKSYANNNGAVKGSYTETVKEEPDIYFSKLATDLLNSENREAVQAFGLISASLGKKSNIDLVTNKVIEPLLEIMKEKEGIAARKKKYIIARKKFLDQYSLVQELGSELDKPITEEDHYFSYCNHATKLQGQVNADLKALQFKTAEFDRLELKLQEDVERFNNEQRNLAVRTDEACKIVSALESQLKFQQDYIQAAETRTDTLRKNVSWFHRLFKTSKFRKTEDEINQILEEQGRCLQQISEETRKIDETKQKSISFQQKIRDMEAEIEGEKKKIESDRKEIREARERERALRKQLDRIQENISEKKIALKELRREYQKKSLYEKSFMLDKSFIKDVLSEDVDVSTRVQLKNPWISEHYNREREKLFLYALQMTKEFILGSSKCKDNFEHLYCLWNGNYRGGDRVKFEKEDLQECTAATYETLFLLIPVVSSTFASMQRLFKNANEENIIGTLIVDEAGQASPHMAIGSLCRARKAIIVGDPKQVEPVVTDDQDLLRQTYTEDIFRLYADKTHSVQRFADHMNQYGTYLKNSQGAREWVGCPLLVHRRCLSPMFDVSNEISYHGIMKQQTLEPRPEKLTALTMPKSQWINVTGKEIGRKNHFVKEQGNVVIRILEAAFSKNENPDLFIISPFKTVVSGIKEHLQGWVRYCRTRGTKSSLVEHERAMLIWLNRNIGTVHAFQGKEAAEVIFLLGCDASPESAGAIKWVNENIVNVAATRAKYRFYVIGDSLAWQQSRCVGKAKEILDTYAFANIEKELKKENPDREKLEKISAKIPTAASFPVLYETKVDDENEKVLSTTGVIDALNHANIMCRELNPGELARFGFKNADEIKKFGKEIQSNLIWGMKLYFLMEAVRKQTDADIDMSCCGVLFCKAIELRMQECFMDSLKRHFPDYQMKVMQGAGSQNVQVLYLKNARPEEFTLGWYPAFMKKNGSQLGSIMNRSGHESYNKQWWNDFASKLFKCKNERNECCHTKAFRWENLEILLQTMFCQSESKHHIKLNGLMFESGVGALMRPTAKK